MQHPACFSTPSTDTFAESAKKMLLSQNKTIGLLNYRPTVIHFTNILTCDVKRPQLDPLLLTAHVEKHPLSLAEPWS